MYRRKNLLRTLILEADLIFIEENTQYFAIVFITFSTPQTYSKKTTYDLQHTQRFFYFSMPVFYLLLFYYKLFIRVGVVAIIKVHFKS